MKRLTKRQRCKIERIVKLFNNLKEENVHPIVFESGGNPVLNFIREPDIEDEYYGMTTDKAYIMAISTGVLIDVIVP